MKEILEKNGIDYKEENKEKGKKEKGQFYTTHSKYILEGFQVFIPNDVPIIEPFAGKGDLIDWVRTFHPNASITAYDIDPKRLDVEYRDTLTNPPDYQNSWIITNPPYLARNKSTEKKLYDQYDTNDLYKCFIHSLKCQGGIMIIPAGFFFSSRDIDVRCRDEFMKSNKILKVRYFEETIFDDTSTTIVSVAFEKSKLLSSQSVEWERYPSKVKTVFEMKSKLQWIIGGDIYHLPISKQIKIKRHVEGKPLLENEQQTYLTIRALDSGTKEGRISLDYQKGYIYPAKECSRTYATLRITGKELSEEDQIKLSHLFHTFLEQKRNETWSLFLPQYRESKEYARKRIPFELVYRIVNHLISMDSY